MTRRLLAAFAMAVAVQYPPVVASAHEPYGGCDEAYLYPTSEGADHCRDHGWDVPLPVAATWWWTWMERWFV